MSEKKIHSLTIGDPKTGLKYSVGQELKNTGVIIKSIKQDNDFFVQFGKLTYCIYVVSITDPEDPEFVWMRMSSENLIIQYDFR